MKTQITATLLVEPVSRDCKAARRGGRKSKLIASERRERERARALQFGGSGVFPCQVRIYHGVNSVYA